MHVNMEELTNYKFSFLQIQSVELLWIAPILFVEIHDKNQVLSSNSEENQMRNDFILVYNLVN